MRDTIYPPDLEDLMNEYLNKAFATMNCIQIGKIEKVNSNQTCEIQIQVKRRVGETETVNYPLLVDCPYFVLSGGGSYIDMPIKPGDFCLILFNDRNIDTWWDTGNVAEPPDRRKHSLSDGFALVGVNTKDGAFQQNGNSIVINGGPFKVDMTNATGEKLSTIMDDYNDEIQAIVTTGSSTTHVLSPASKAAFAAIKVRQDTLLGS